MAAQEAAEAWACHAAAAKCQATYDQADL
jgi:hypothetical protein